MKLEAAASIYRSVLPETRNLQPSQPASLLIGSFVSVIKVQSKFTFASTSFLSSPASENDKENESESRNKS
jgi:hypothetical protein